MYICPKCGKIDTLSSKGDTVFCSSCSHSFRYDEYGMLSGTAFKTVKEFSDWQKDKTGELVAQGATFSAPAAVLKTVKNHIETPVTEGELCLSAETLRCGNTQIDLSDIDDMAMHGQKAIVFTVGKTYYELLIKEGVNALKFWLYYRFAKNLVKIK